MSTAVISAFSRSEMPGAAEMSKAADKFMPGADKYFVFLDMSRSQLDNDQEAAAIGGNLRVPSDFFGENFNLKEYAFFFDRSEFTSFVTARVCRALLKKYEKVIVVGSSVALNGDFTNIADKLPYENMSLSVTNSSQIVGTSLPLAFIETNISLDAQASRLEKQYGMVFGFSSGRQTDRFLEWCGVKFTYLFSSAYSSFSKNSDSRKQSLFYTTWMNYGSVFSLANFSFCFSYDVNKYKKTEYAYDCFTDGTIIYPYLRLIYCANQMVYDKCCGDPFANIQVFTDESVLIGDADPLPLTAMEDYCVNYRNDIASVFPNYNTSDRAALTNWFITYGSGEYKLPGRYTSKISELYSDYSGKRRNLAVRAISVLKTRLFGNAPEESRPMHEPGVNLCGFIRGDFGLAQATRLISSSFVSGKLPFSIINYQPAGLDDFSNHEWDSKIDYNFNYNTNIILLNGQWIKFFFNSVSTAEIKREYNIGLWYWELPECPKEWIPFFDYFDEIWAASDFCAEAFRKVTKKPVTTVPSCVMVKYDETITRKYFSLPEDKFLFLSMYDMRSMQKRKNPAASIKAFQKAFGNRSDVALVIKVSAPDGWDTSELRNLVAAYDNIILLIATYTKPVLNSLINCCDAFISLHRSEGFGLGPAEAMYLGKPAVITNWSGNTQYMRPDNCCPVDYKIIEIDKDIGPYKKGCHWADPDIDSAAGYMRRLVDDRDYYKMISENGRRTIREEFSPEAVCETAKKRLRELKLL
jgi:glycosyltransferase involved in cell wall biosynthesis